MLHGVFGMLPPDPARRLPDPPRPLSEPAPAALRDFDSGAEPVRPRVAELALVFPPAGATMILSRGDRFRPIPLRARGGARPVRWLVNGRPMDQPVWRPDGPGAATVTALDRLGQSASASIWVE